MLLRFHILPGGEHVPLTGPTHDQMVHAEGLPDLPGARQDGGRPASVPCGHIRPFRPRSTARPFEGMLRCDLSHLLLCGVYARDIQGQGHGAASPSGASSLRVCVCPRYPRAGTRSGEPIGRQLSELVYAQDIQGQGHGAASPWAPAL